MSRKAQAAKPQKAATTKRKARRLSLQQRIAREREILARFDFNNRPALLAARVERAARRKRSQGGRQS
jgi:hypothetical protein